MNFFKKIGKTMPDKDLVNSQEADPYYAPDLVEHRQDYRNILLGSESINFVGGHALTEVVYYSALHQVIIHNCAMFDGKNGYRSTVERVQIPEHLTARAEIIAYLKQNDSAPTYLLREEECNCNDQNTISSPDPSFMKKPGVKWEINSGAQKAIQYIYFNSTNSTSFGSEESDGPTILLERDHYIYLYISFDNKSDSYMAIEDFDGPLRYYPHGKSFTYGIESFTLL